jgi:hypothetical protein
MAALNQAYRFNMFVRTEYVGILFVSIALVKFLHKASRHHRTGCEWLRGILRFGSPKKRPRAVVYVRHQSHVTDPKIVCRQIANCTQKALSIGAQVTHVFKDESGGGGIFHRPALGELIRAARDRSDNFSIVIVDDIDRVSRKTGSVEYMLDLLSECDVDLHSVKTGKLNKRSYLFSTFADSWAKVAPLFSNTEAK